MCSEVNDQLLKIQLHAMHLRAPVLANGIVCLNLSLVSTVRIGVRSI